MTTIGDSSGADACGINPAGDHVWISQSMFDAKRNRTSSSVCGHQLWAEGQGTNAETGNPIKGESLALTVVGYCKCTGLRQPCDRIGIIDD